MVRIELEEDVRIPAGITDVAAFRHWAVSDDFPERGRFSFLRDVLWVDLTMEQLFSHNRVKTRITSALDDLVAAEAVGYYFSDGVLLSHPEIGLSTEPDGMFVRYDAVQRGACNWWRARAAATSNWSALPTWSWKWSAPNR